jgi:hypothetical protein
MWYIATLWVIEAANIAVSPLITAHKRNAAATLIWRRKMQSLRN